MLVSTKEFNNSDIGYAGVQSILDSPYNYKELDYTNIISIIDSFRKDPDKVLILEHNDQEVVGFLMGIVSKHPLFSDVTVACEYTWWVKDTYRKKGCGLRLLRKFEKWATEQNATHLSITHFVRDTQLQKLMSKKNYTHFESTYIKEL